MINEEKALQTIYDNLAKLPFSKLLLVNAQVSEHIFNCWQHHEAMRLQKLNGSTRPTEQALPVDKKSSKSGKIP